MKRFGWKFKAALFLLSLGISLGIAEFAFRVILFSGSPAFAPLRNAGLYASLYSDDYWKLEYRFGNGYKPPKNPNPLLGWTGAFKPRTFMHWDIEEADGRRPVLLYGDSFAQCMKQSKCYEKFLNADSAFTRRHYFFNYGVGGFGTDQILLLMKNTVTHFDKPFVVFSLLTSDLDRSILSVRTGQKPFFEIRDDSLVLKGTPIFANADSFYRSHPPSIGSYLWRRFLFSDLNFLPRSWSESLTGVKHFQEKIISVNTLILRDAVNFLRSHDVEFVFLVFQTDERLTVKPEDMEWREQFLLDFLKKERVPYVWARDVLKEAIGEEKNYSVEKYFIKGDGHPTTEMNAIISEKIKTLVLASPQAETWQPDRSDSTLFSVQLYRYEQAIRNSPDWLARVLKDAADKHADPDLTIRKHAEYVLDEKNGEL